jgi:transcriptional regulator with XRE-family HTH domain
MFCAYNSIFLEQYLMIYLVPVKLADPNFLEAFGARLATIRKVRGLTQTQLADAIGVKQYVIASYETGRSQMPISLIHPVALTLGVEPAELLGDQPIQVKRGPTPKMQNQFDRICQLPKSKQRQILEVVEALLAQQSENLSS